MNRAAYGSQVVVTCNNLLLSLAAITLLKDENFKIWFIVSQSYFIAQSFLRSAYFEPANFQMRQLKVTLSQLISSFLLIGICFYIVIGIWLSFSFVYSIEVATAVSISLFQDYLRYRYISLYSRNVVIADSLITSVTLPIIMITRVNSIFLFIQLYLLLPNLVSIVYLLSFGKNEMKTDSEVFKFRLKSIFGVSSLIELCLNQTLTMLSAIFLSNSDLKNLRIMQLISSPLSSLRLFSWTGLITSSRDNRFPKIKRRLSSVIELMLYLTLAISLFTISESGHFSFLPRQSRLTLIFFLLTNLLSLFSVGLAVRIRITGKVSEMLYFALSFPLFSICYLAILNERANLSHLIVIQFVITLLNSTLAFAIMRQNKLRN